MPMIELSFSIEVVPDSDAVLPSERASPTAFQIIPYQDEGVEGWKFYVKFEPDNPERRRQPFRDNIAPIFPNGWKIGDPYP